MRWEKTVWKNNKHETLGTWSSGTLEQHYDNGTYTVCINSKYTANDLSNHAALLYWDFNNLQQMFTLKSDNLCHKCCTYLNAMTWQTCLALIEYVKLRFNKLRTNSLCADAKYSLTLKNTLIGNCLARFQRKSGSYTELIWHYWMRHSMQLSQVQMASQVHHCLTFYWLSSQNICHGGLLEGENTQRAIWGENES